MTIGDGETWQERMGVGGQVKGQGGASKLLLAHFWQSPDFQHHAKGSHIQKKLISKINKDSGERILK